MKTFHIPLETEMDELRSLRDDVRVRLHRAPRNLRETWNEAESRWCRLESEYARIRQAADPPEAGIRTAIFELGERYVRMNEALSRAA